MRKVIIVAYMLALTFMFSLGYIVREIKKDNECKQTMNDNTEFIQIIESYGRTIGDLKSDGFSDEVIEEYVINNCIPLLEYKKGF